LTAPDWLVVKKINEVAIPREKFTIDMERWPKIARERIIKFVNKQRWFPAEGINRSSYEKEIYDEYAGHGLLRIVAAEDPRVRGWLIEQEGDLFEWRFLKSRSLEIKLEVARYLFGYEKVISPRELWNKFDIEEPCFKEFKMASRRNNSIGVHFTCTPKMVGNRSALLKEGWVIAPIDNFTGSVKRAFEALLRERIKETGESLDRITRASIAEPIKELREELGRVIHRVGTMSDRIALGDYRLYTRQSLFPQCMLDLYNEVMNRGHITHQERLQLGLFLKNIGMSVEEQLLFWYERAVDNIGLTYEQFVSGPAGYQIRYMYGLEGGGTDYSAHKCESIQNNAYCTFLHQSVQQIDESLRREFKNPSNKQQELITQLLRKVVDKKPSEACAIMFQLRYNRYARPIRHPINYLQYAAKTLKLIKEEKEEEKGGKERPAPSKKGVQK